MADKETKEDYKARVQKAKRIVQKMFVEGQKKEIPMYKIERDVESFLDSQNLTKFDLRTNGDRKNQAVLQAFTNKANKGIMEILKVIAPSVAVQLDPVHVASHFALGRALVGLKRNDEARAVLTAGINAAQSGHANGGGDLVPEMRMLLQSL